MSAETCTDCGRCVPHCPVLRDQSVRPQRFFADKAEAEKAALTCVGCNLCFTLCGEDLHIGAVFKEQRALLLAAPSSKVKKGIKTALTHQKLSFSKPFTAARKPAGSISRVAFMPGCSFANRSPALIGAVYVHLKTLYPGIGYLQQCCGKPTLAIGEGELFNEYYGRLERDIAALQAETVITACENCYMMLKKKSPQVKTVSLYEALLAGDAPEKAKERLANAPEMALHDPCPTRDEPVLHESTRALLYRSGVAVKEFKFNRQKTLCCGAGNMTGLIDPDACVDQARHRIDQAGCEHIVTYCQSCTDVFNYQGKNTLHLMELLFDPAVIRRGFRGVKMGPVTRWANRFLNRFTR